MKKQIFTLMFSAAILTTNPLWAMDSVEPDAEKAIAHKCPSCQPELRFSNIDQDARKETLLALPDDVLVKALSLLPLKDVVHNVSLVSKTMYNLCQTPFIWSCIYTRETDSVLAPSICAKHTFINERHPSHLFSKPRSYAACLNQLSLTPSDEPFSIVSIKIRTFKIGNTQFTISGMEVKDGENFEETQWYTSAIYPFNYVDTLITFQWAGKSYSGWLTIPADNQKNKETKILYTVERINSDTKEETQ